MARPLLVCVLRPGRVGHRAPDPAAVNIGAVGTRDAESAAGVDEPESGAAVGLVHNGWLMRRGGVGGSGVGVGGGGGRLEPALKGRSCPAEGAIWKEGAMRRAPTSKRYTQTFRTAIASSRVKLDAPQRNWSEASSCSASRGGRPSAGAASSSGQPETSSRSSARSADVKSARLSPVSFVTLIMAGIFLSPGSRGRRQCS